MEVATGIWEVTINDPAYPALLKQIPDAPSKLYVRGNLDWCNQLVVAVVGSRKPTPYGVQITGQLVEPIAKSCVIVSGLAYGIDALVHQAALKGGGVTVAVLGSGLDDASIYPSKNLTLAKQILAKGGALISEHPSGAEPLKHHFPLRNRIIAGLSSKVVVIEAGRDSGALITAKLALDYNREVLAVPGLITNPLAHGTNWLITQGAQPVLRAADIADTVVSNGNYDLTDVEEMIYNSLMSSPKHLDEIVRLTNLATAQVNSTLTLLEMKGIIMATGQGTFAVANSKITNIK